MAGTTDNIPYNHDERLDKLTPGQYRLWHDAHNVLVPVGQSISQPLMKEIVNVNAKVYGEINQAFFNRPMVDFTNTNVVTERFDRYKLQIWRDELPDDPIIDWHDDLGLNSVTIRVAVQFTCNGIVGEYSGDVPILYQHNKNWQSEKLHFDLYGLQYLIGDFYIVCNPDNPLKNGGYVFSTGDDLQTVNLPLSIVVEECKIRNGNSTMQILYKNPLFQLQLTGFTFIILGGE